MLSFRVWKIGLLSSASRHRDDCPQGIKPQTSVKHMSLLSTFILMADQAINAKSLWSHDLDSDARRRIYSLYQTRCDEASIPGERSSIHLITLYQMIQYIGHTIYDESHLSPRDEEFLKNLEVDVRRRGDTIVRDHLMKGGIMNKVHVMYMLVRNIRNKVEVNGVRGPLMLFNVTDNGLTFTIRYAQPRGPSEFIFVEEAPWMYASKVVSGSLFELDTSDDFGSFLEQLGLPNYEHKSKFVKISSIEVQESSRSLWGTGPKVIVH